MHPGLQVKTCLIAENKESVFSELIIMLAIYVLIMQTAFQSGHIKIVQYEKRLMQRKLKIVLHQSPSM